MVVKNEVGSLLLLFKALYLNSVLDARVDAKGSVQNVSDQPVSRAHPLFLFLVCHKYLRLKSVAWFG